MLVGPGGGSGNPIPGDPQSLYDIAHQLLVLSNGLEGAMKELHAIDAGDFHGKAGDAFRAVVKIPPKEFAAAAGAFASASNTITGFADALSAAQKVAGNAQQLTQAGSTATSKWQAMPPNQPARPTTDPGATDTQQGASLLSQAQGDLHTAAQLCIKALKDAEAGAPKKPSLLDRVLGDVESIGHGLLKTSSD